MHCVLRENVSIRDLRRLLGGALDTAPNARATEQTEERVRQKMPGQLTAAYAGSSGTHSAPTLETSVEALFRTSLSEIAAEQGSALAPRKAEELGDDLEAGVFRMQTIGLAPCLITSQGLRHYIGALAEGRCALLDDLSFREMEPSARIKPIETISSGAQAA